MKSDRLDISILCALLQSKLTSRNCPPNTYVKNTSTEFETKIWVTSVEQVQTIFSRLSCLQFSGSENRSEYHVLHEFQDGDTCAKIFVEGESAPWFKTKIETETIHSVKHGLPIIRRTSHKYKPTEYGYDVAAADHRDAKFLGRFKKLCYNYFFEFEGCLFSMSFSLASNEIGFEHYQIELEYENPLKHDFKSEIEILAHFDSLFDQYFFDQIAVCSTKSHSLRKLEKE